MEKCQHNFDEVKCIDCGITWTMYIQKEIRKQTARKIFADFDDDIRKGKGSIVLTKHKLEIKKKKYGVEK